MTANTWIGIAVAAVLILLVVGSLVADHYGLLPTNEELHQQDEARWARMNPTRPDPVWEARLDQLEQRKGKAREHNQS